MDGGDSHSLAVKADGTVWAWGYNGSGALGDGSKVNRSTPTQVPGLIAVVAILAAPTHSLAVSADGVIKAFGSNSGGQLGTGAPLTRLSPIQVW
ncbi:RCC1 domain-containing protein [Corallococcus terminator]